MSKGLAEIVVDDKFIRSVDELRVAGDGSLFKKCSESVIVFSELMLGLRLYSWQAFFLSHVQRAVDGDYWTKEFLALTSRQVGKSTALAILSLWACVFNKYPAKLGVGTNTRVGIVSAGDNHAKTLLREVKRLIIAGDEFIRSQYVDDEGKPLISDKFFSNLIDDHAPNNTTTISFKPYKEKNHGDYLLKGSVIGSTIESYPPTDIVLGKAFTMVFEDEAGKSDKVTDEFHEDYMYPTGNANNAIRVYTSTPWSPSGFFYRLADPSGDYNDHPAERFMFTIDSIRIENGDYYEEVKKIIDQKNADGKVDEVQRAYYCRFVKGEQTYFDPKKVYDVFNNDYEEFDSYLGECDVGIDFGGQVKSRTVVTVSRLTSDGFIDRLYHRAYGVREDKGLLEDLKFDILKRFPNYQRIVVDDCPAGDFLIRLMEEEGWNIHRMSFRAEKVKKYGAFRSSLNNGLVRSYQDSDLKTEMLALEFSNSSRQSVIQHAPGYSDDLIDSFLMSVYFFVQEEGGFRFYDWDDD